jgi:hypothetical protein
MSNFQSLRIVCRLILLCLPLSSCKNKQAGEISFYYWKTKFSLSATEKNVLNDEQVKKLYIRYFDVDKETPQVPANPVSPVTLDNSVKKYEVVPVVYIKKRVLENIDSNGLNVLANNILKLVSQINRSQQIQNKEIQFDCDWTEQTRDAYFFFINLYRTLTDQFISATIRLHQVKYYKRTGIPPVDRGVLMYYNMGEINSSPSNSIYDKTNAARYNASLSGYPLPIDIALPIFSWGQQIRNNHVIQLLNKISGSHFQNDSNFVFVNASRLLARHSCFKAGYYFVENDEIKLESVSQDELLFMSAQIKKYALKKFSHVIFYDLDSTNLVQYEKNIYKKIRRTIN